MVDLTLSQDKLASMERFQALLPEVRQYINEHRPRHWPEMCTILGQIADRPLGPLPILPLASCAAVGGDGREAIPVAAAWEVLNLAVRILDDLQDKDRPGALWTTVGAARAFNYSAALYALCNDLLAAAAWPAEKYRAISRTFAHEALNLAAGQDRDLRGETLTVDDCWRTMEDKNASAFALACMAGALCGTDDPILLDACRAFGHHLGLALQLFDDLEGLWEPSGTSDLAVGKITLPVIYGLSVAHQHRDELRQLISGGDLVASVDRVKEILDGIGTRDFLVWAALQERHRAVEALAPCPGQTGVTALVGYVTAIFARVEEIVLPSTPNRSGAPETKSHQVRQ